MAVTTIITNKESKFSNVLIYILGILGVGLVVFFGGQVIENLDNLRGKSGVSVEVQNNSAQIIIDNQKVGDTIYTSKDLKPGTKTITLKSDTRQYQTSISFVAAENGTMPIVGIIRDLGVSDFFSSGQEFWFEKDKSGNVLRIISEPQGAAVSIDGSKIGETTFSSNSISTGTYELKITYSGYEPQVSSITIQKGFTLNGNVKLFPYPTPLEPKVFPDSSNLYDLSIDNASATSDTQSWVKAVVYWNTTRGINIAGVTNPKDKAFDYFIDYKGNTYDADGNAITKPEDFEKIKGAKREGYLGRVSDGAGLTKEAKEAFTGLGTKGVSAKTAMIKTTPTGWLRVRDAASLSGNEIAKVNVGDKFPVLETATGWVKIQVSATAAGWVSADYVGL